MTTQTDAGTMYGKLRKQFRYHLVQSSSNGYACLVRSSNQMNVLIQEVGHYADSKSLMILNADGKKL